MPKVSVIVPVYNVEAYLRAAMDSLIRQTLRDIEIVCINDGSTDGSLEILKEYTEKDDRIVLVDKENGGYGLAMNIGLDRATGEYVGILEPDDFVGLTMYEDLYEAAKENDLDIVKADFWKFVTDEQKETETYTYAHLARNPEDYNTVFKPLNRKASFFYIMNTWSGIYRLSFLRDKKIRHQETPGAAFQDNGFWFQTFIYAERVMILDKPLYRVRRDNPNSSVYNPAKVYAANVEYDFIRGILKKNPKIWERTKDVYWRKRYHNYDATQKRIAPACIPEYRRQAGKELKWALKRGEFSQQDFPAGEWNNIQAMIRGQSEPGKGSDMPTKKDIEAENELALIMNSRSYRLGRMLTAIPRKIRSLLRRGQHE